MDTSTSGATASIFEETPCRFVVARTARGVSSARRWIHRRLAGCGCADDARLVASELLTNAFDHGTGSCIVIHLEHGRDGATLRVTDNGPAKGTKPEIVIRDHESPDGRGLALVEALCQGQWHSDTPNGKTQVTATVSHNATDVTRPS